jgi:hypothetical protein
MSYADLIRDARDEALTPSTRIRAAFDALYSCCLQFGGAEGMRTDDAEQFVQTVIGRALAAIPLSAEDTALVHRLAAWVLHEAPLEPLPLSPDDAIALAERVHNKSTGSRDAKSNG